jgi:hypothetical protein
MFRSKRRNRRAVYAALMGALVLIGSSMPDARAEDGQEEESFDTKIFNNVLRSLGLRRSGESTIDYRERSPLVLPSGRQLPPPEPKSAPTKAAGWPDDPDVKRDKALKEAARKERRLNPEEVGPLLPSQYSLPNPPSRRSRPDGTEQSVEQSSSPMSPYDLGAKNPISSIWAPKEEYATFVGEPPRTSLTEPPAGYRTPSPNQPYGIGKEKWTGETRERHEPHR